MVYISIVIPINNVILQRTTVLEGAGYARKVGLDWAKGKWLQFADSDVLLVDDFCEKANKCVEIC